MVAHSETAEIGKFPGIPNAHTGIAGIAKIAKVAGPTIIFMIAPFVAMFLRTRFCLISDALPMPKNML